MSVYISKAQLLIEQERYELAEKELIREISESPENPVAHALLALCLSNQKKYIQAVQEAHMAIGFAPDLSFCHYVLGVVLVDQGQLDKAEAAIREALALDSWHPEYYGLLASIKINQKKWQEALDFASEGLKIEPENVQCINLLGIALTKLGFKREAIYSIDSALAHDPENAFTHANQGWTLLEHGEHKKALEHFREALRLEPNLEYARDGILEALKAKNFIYRMLLKYFFWMSKLSNKNQWIFIIGLIVGVRLLRELAKIVPVLAPVITPIIILYFIFVFLVWTSDPLFNLLLRLDKFGRLALSEEQVFASNVVGMLIGGSALSFIIFLVALNSTFIDTSTPLLTSIFLGLMILPASGALAKKKGRGRKILGLYTIALGLTGVVAVISFNTSESLFGTASMLFILGFVIFTWAANFIH